MLEPLVVIYLATGVSLTAGSHIVVLGLRKLAECRRKKINLLSELRKEFGKR